MDEDLLTPQIIEQLIKYMPQPNQMSQLAELKAEYKTMAEPEQFGVVVSTARIHTHTNTHTHTQYMPQPNQMSQLAELEAEYKTMAEPEQFGVVVSTARIHTDTHTHSTCHNRTR